MSPKVIDEDALQAREQVLLDTALEMITEYGVAALTMDKLVSRVPYSKGTVYNHFSSKEDLLIGLCNNSMKGMLEMFQRLATFDGSSRERMLGIGFAYMLYTYLYPAKFMLVITAKTPSVSEKTSLARQDEHQNLDNKLLGVALEIIEDAVAKGELHLGTNRQPEQVAFSVWAMCFGTIALLSENVERCSARSDLSLEREVVNHANLVLDGLNWLPLSHQTDTGNLIERLKSGPFKPEIELLAEQGRCIQPET